MKVLVAVLVAAVVGLGCLSWFFKTQSDQRASDYAVLDQDFQAEKKSRLGLEQKSESMLAEKNQEIQRLTQQAVELEELQGVVKGLRDDLAAKADLAKTTQEKVVELTGAVETAKQERDKVLQDLKQLRDDHEAVVKNLADAKTSAANVAIERDKALTEKTALAQKLAQAEAECDNLKKTVEKLQGLAPKLAGKEIEGKVLEGGGDGNVILSELNQKPEVDLEFSVFRGGEFIGRVKVYKAFENYAGARVTYLTPGKDVQTGDIVKTGFPEK